MNQSPQHAGLRGAAGLIVILALAGCATNEPSRVIAPAGVAVPQTHVLSSAELRRIMQRLEALMEDRVQTDLALDARRRESAAALADAAGELAAAASSLSASAVTASLDETARRQFRTYALELHREATQLGAVADENRIIASAEQFRRLNHTCAACHSLFRGR